MDEFLDELLKVIEKSRKSKAAAAPVITASCNYIAANNPNRSKAASVSDIHKVKAIHDFITSNGRL